MKNFSLNVNKLTLLLGLVTAAMTYFLPFVPITPQLAVAIVGFWGFVTSAIKTYQAVPTKDDAPGPSDPTTKKRISFPPGMTELIFAASFVVVPALALCVALLPGCTAAQLQDAQAKALPVLTKAQAVALQVEQLAELAEAHGVTPEAILSARDAAAQKHFGEAIELLYQGLAVAAKAGHEIPATAMAAVTLLRDAALAQSIQDGTRAVSGK